MNNKLIMRSLPLVAAVLGNKYGVKVNVGGSEAFTDGNTIHLPGLAMDSDKELIGLARGYIDHESAHIRETDFDALQKANLTPLEMNIWNSIEDWRVEEKLASVFPGCRGNFHWLIRHVFNDARINERSPPADLIPDWILLTVRSWHVADLKGPRDQAESVIESQYPGLAEKIKSVLQEAGSKCQSTGDSILLARKIVLILKKQTKEANLSQPLKNGDFMRPKRAKNDLSVPLILG